MPPTAPSASLPSQSELVIGFVGPVGIDLKAIFDDLAKVLSRFEYHCHDVHLSEQLHELDWDQDLKEEPADERIRSYMTAGNRLREAWDNDAAFALLAINGILLARQEAGGGFLEPLDRHAYVLRSLKRPEEAKLLRDVYGSRFVLLSIYSPKDARVAYLNDRIGKSRVPPHAPEAVYPAEQLVADDEAENADHGQKVRGIFHEGDFFIDARRDVAGQLERSMELLFGHPNRTPTREETGMFHALAASRRSAELGRQVGAAICTSDGAVVAVGTNEVPRAGGGLYWEGDEPDHREFTRKQDTNDAKKAELIQEVVDELVGAELLAGPEAADEAKALLASSSVDDLIEFVRAVHAEMAAVTDAARRGIAVAETVLYVTTFPCHHCARHIVAAGIRKVVYVAPYAKSLAADLHGDAIHVDPAKHKRKRRRITFEPFVGVGPSRYLDLFEMPARKDHASGRVVRFRPESAQPRIAEIESPELQAEVPPYMRRERRAEERLIRIQQSREPRFTAFAEALDENRKK